MQESLTPPSQPAYATDLVWRLAIYQMGAQAFWHSHVMSSCNCPPHIGVGVRVTPNKSPWCKNTVHQTSLPYNAFRKSALKLHFSMCGGKCVQFCKCPQVNSCRFFLVPLSEHQASFPAPMSCCRCLCTNLINSELKGWVGEEGYI